MSENLQSTLYYFEAAIVVQASMILNQIPKRRCQNTPVRHAMNSTGAVGQNLEIMSLMNLCEGF